MKSLLLINLYELMERMKRRRDNPKSDGLLERYNWFINNSNMGDSCKYAKKYLDIFISEDYEDIKKLFLECIQEFRKVEGDDFGR